MAMPDFLSNPHSRLEIHPQCLYQPAIRRADTYSASGKPL
jgi:hypothetical protein